MNLLTIIRLEPAHNVPSICIGALQTTNANIVKPIASSVLMLTPAELVIPSFPMAIVWMSVLPDPGITMSERAEYARIVLTVRDVWLVTKEFVPTVMETTFSIMETALLDAKLSLTVLNAIPLTPMNVLLAKMATNYRLMALAVVLMDGIFSMATVFNGVLTTIILNHQIITAIHALLVVATVLMPLLAIIVRLSTSSITSALMNVQQEQLLMKIGPEAVFKILFII